MGKPASQYRGTAHLNSFAALSLDESVEDEATDSPVAEVPSDEAVKKSEPPLPSDVIAMNGGSSAQEVVQRQYKPHRSLQSTVSKTTQLHLRKERYKSFVPPGQWRDHDQETIAEHRRKSGVIPSTAKAGTDETVLRHGGQRNELREQPSGVHRWDSAFTSQQTAEKLVFHVDRRFASEGKGHGEEGDTSPLSEGSPGEPREKKRYFLIVERVGSKVRECPVYTYGDLGLKKRDPSIWAEYRSLRPEGVHEADFYNQSPGHEVLDIEWAETGRMKRHTMVVRFTEVAWREIGTVVEVVGSISASAQKEARRTAAEYLEVQELSEVEVG